MKVNKTLLTVAIGTALAGAAVAVSQPQSNAPLTFEAATVKPNASGDNRVMMQRAQGGRLNMTGAPLRLLVRNAYGIQDFQIIGGPQWMNSDRWDVQAKSEENVSPAQANEMLQNLLADRFQLKFHKETRELPVYELAVGKGGLKIAESRADGAPVRVQVPGLEGSAAGRGEALGRGMMVMGRGQIAGSGMSMTQLTQLLSNNLGRTVIDKTGLAGTYDIKLQWTPDASQGAVFAGPPGGGGGGERGAAPGDDALPSIFTAVQEQLGLKLDSGKGPVEVFVIDRVEKPVEPQHQQH